MAALNFYKLRISKDPNKGCFSRFLLNLSIAGEKIVNRDHDEGETDVDEPEHEIAL